MKKILIITSDDRQKHIATYLKQHHLIIYENTEYVKDYFDALILPMSPLLNKELLQHNSYKMILGGRLSKDDLEIAKKNKIELVDYFDNEYVKYENAFLTAEAAIAIAINNSAISLKNSKCIITGFGRIGKILAKLLNAFNCDITITARKDGDLGLINTLGYKSIYTEELSDISKFNYIFNTIPYPILDKILLETVQKKALIIDLASKPGGTDFSYVKSKGLNCIHALSLPSKFSPESDAEILSKSILKILSERS